MMDSENEINYTLYLTRYGCL